ncbi:hypothetical protein G6F56_011814 [Rhizopus delemar]|nr:hypothetical protein G6F56_011814 [Rhizopus delemar]
MTVVNAIEALTAQIIEVKSSNNESKSSAQAHSSAIDEIKVMLSSILQQRNVVQESSETTTQTTVDTETSTTPRERNILLKFQKIVTPNGAKIRIRDRLGPLLANIKVYTSSNGQEVPENIKKYMVAEDIKCLNAIALIQSIKMKQSLDLCYVNNRLTWKNVPERCQGKWAARGLLANHWQDNFNPKRLSKKFQDKAASLNPSAVTESNGASSGSEETPDPAAENVQE